MQNICVSVRLQTQLISDVDATYHYEGNADETNV